MKVPCSVEVINMLCHDELYVPMPRVSARDSRALARSHRAMMDEMMIHEDDARKPAAFPFTLAGKMAREMRDWSGTPGSWVHVGDDVVNDCEAAKTHGPFKTVLVAHPGVVPWGQPRVDPARAVNSTSGTDEVESSELVDVRVTSVGEIPGAIAGLYAS